MNIRQPYPSDVNNDEWAFVAPYSSPLSEDVLQRRYDLREVYNGLRWLAPDAQRGAWRMLARDFSRQEADYQQIQRWLRLTT